MASLLTRGQTALIERQQVAAVSGNTISYQRGVQSIDLTNIAWTGRTVFASNMDDAARIEFGDRDYLIPVANLTFGEPQIGDRIAETVGSTIHTFEAMTPDTGEPAWRYSDQGRTVYRIHTKEV